jgi:Tol biopolymer transport system component/predicted Ser/Thr protein kinase
MIRSAARPVLTVGDILGDCEILALLGQGGMGEVYLARDRRLGRKVALKVLPSSFASDDARLARFEREARSASALNHPNICTIHSLGELPDGRRFIVMEHVEGMTLRGLQHKRPGLPRVIEVGRQLAGGLAAAHDAGIVHRDVKPENVMIRADGLVKILDFGLAKILPESNAAGQSTQSTDGPLTGGIVGTVQYMSPEQTRGLPTDGRTDIWAVGVVLYQLTTGQSPFGGATPSDVIANVLHAEPPPLGRFAPDCPPELQRIVTKCLRKDRDHRYQTMRDVALDLEALRDTSVPLPVAAPSASVRLSRRWLVVAGSAVVVLLAGAGGAWWMNLVDTSRQTGSDAAPHFRRLTFDAGLQTDASFSPDSRLIAYASDRSGNLDIWVQPVDGGDAVQITHEVAKDEQPAWSPDGKSIAFRSERSGGGIFVMPALGGHARQVSTFGSHPTWLNRTEILFIAGNVDAGLATAAQVYVASVDGDAPREILRDFLADGGLYWAAGRHDGRISVLALRPSTGAGFFTLSRDGRAMTTSHIPSSFPFNARFLESTPTRFVWNHAGTALYLEATIDGIQNLWRISVDPNSLEWLSVKRLTTGPGRDVAASLSSDGRRLAYTTTSEQTRVYLQGLSADGRRVDGAPAAVTEAGAEAFGSSLSHDGRSLAYIIRRAGSERFELRVAHLDAGRTELLDDDVLGNVNSAWSPDDQAVLHQRIKPLEGHPDRFQAELVRHEPGGRETVLLPWSQTAFLAKDGTVAGHDLLGAVFHFSGTPSEIAGWSVVDGTSLKPGRVLFTDPKANLWEATYAPGRRWISFVRVPLAEAQRSELMIGPVEGGSRSGWTRLAADHSWADKPRWSADGRLLYFLSRGSSAYFNLWAIPFDPIRGVPTGSPFTVTNYDSPTLFVSPNVEKTGMDVANGHVTLTMTSTTGSIWMLDDLEPRESAAGSR